MKLAAGHDVPAMTGVMRCIDYDWDLLNSIRLRSKEKQFRLGRLAISGGVGATVNASSRAER